MAFAIRTWPRRLIARPWLLGFVPINAATSGFGVVLPLLILITLHGSWADVAVAATVYNSSVILMSVVWGHLSDVYRHRRTFLVVNFGGYAALYGLLSQVHTLPELFAIYLVIGALAPAGASASNLLILEKFTEQERPNAFASFQEMSMLGSLAGLLIGYFWTLRSDALLTLLFVLAGLALASAVALWFGIKEAPRQLTTASVAHHPESLFSRLRAFSELRVPIPFFPHRPRIARDPIGRFRRWAREELRHELPLIFIASFLFNLSANLFNISYTPFLYSAGLTAASIFLVNLSNNFAQTLVFPLTGGLANRLGPDRLVQHASYLRSIGYLATAGLTFVVFARGGAFSADLAIYALLGGAIAVYTTASSLMLFRGLQGRDAGSLLGLNSALGGVAAVAGAGLSGFLAIYGSYRLVFLVSGGALLVSLPLWTAASIAYARRRYAPSAPLPPTGARPALGRVDAGSAAKSP
ncbi:MAG TPA: MFS transporter [Thermoplasmata archaeon]|nr:MFS transporter [Thermoplasmata archaeon]